MTPSLQNWLDSTWKKLKDRNECNAYIAVDQDWGQTLTLSATKGAADVSYTRIRLSQEGSWGIWERDASPVS
jgi:hypothetical protein